MVAEKRKILIVDDETDVVDTIDTILTEEGFETHVSRNGKDALLKVRELSPELVLLDCYLPEMMGIEVLREIRKLSEEIAVVMMTGHGEEQLVVALMKAGASDYLKKPLGKFTLLSAVKDVLRKKDINREIIQSERLLLLGELFPFVAHEIRNPLAAIVQANALLEEDLHDPGQKQLAQMVQQNAERLARIADEVLDIARVQHQISHAPASALMLDETVALVWTDWQRQSPAQRHGRVSLMAEGAQVEFDAEHLRRVLFNLLDNALRYKGPEDDSLVITTRASALGQISLQVWSDGEPMDKSVERHLFEPFFSSESRSSGLGLYICRELCQRHGASIDYQRLVRTTPRGEVGGNAFTVGFRRNTRPAANATLFDTIVV